MPPLRSSLRRTAVAAPVTSRATSPDAPEYTFDVRTGRYRNVQNGRLVSAADVRRTVDAALGASENRAKALTEQLRAGGLTLDDWAAGMRREIKRANLYGAAAAAGGWDHLTAADYGRVGQRVRQEYGYLAEFARKLADGTMPLDGRAVSYAGQYSQAGRATYYAAELVNAPRRGQREARNILHAQESCAGANSCQAESAREWVPVNTMSAPGTRKCRRRCKCTLVFR